MYQLTIHAGGGRTASEHPDWPTAHRHLIDYVKARDYYVELVQAGLPHTSYELLDLGDVAEEQSCRAQGRHPRTVGHAVIEELTRTPTADPPYYAAAAARRWIDDQRGWQVTGVRDGTPFPERVFVLLSAEPEGRCRLAADVLLREAAELAGVEPIPDPDQALLETLRRDAIRREGATPSPAPAELAAIVQLAAPADTSAAHMAALIWWYALLTWGATAASSAAAKQPSAAARSTSRSRRAPAPP